MTLHDFLSLLLQGVLIVCLCLGGVYAFAHASINGLNILETICHRIAEMVPPRLRGLLDPPTVFANLVLLLSVIGLNSVVRQQKGTRRFVLFISLLYLPLFIAYSSKAWFHLLHYVIWRLSRPPQPAMPTPFFVETAVSYHHGVALGLLLISGYLGLQFSSRFRQFRRDLVYRGADEQDAVTIGSRNHLYMFLVLGLAIGTMTILLIPSLDVGTLLSSIVAVPVGMLIIGVGASVMLVALLYYYINLTYRQQ
jgi:hypothetical protein